MLNRLLQFLTLLFTFTLVILSANINEVIVSGFVKDASTGEALIGTNILLYDNLTAEGIPYRGVASNRHGYYAFPNLSKGVYVIVFRNIGYEEYRDTINITVESGSMRLDADLNREDILMNEVIVSGERKSKAIVSEIKLSQGILKSLPTMSGEVDIFKSLELIPGVQTASEISNGLYIRGGSPDQTLTLVDNMVVYNPSHLGNFSSTFNSNVVQDIILVKGAYPAEYGGRLSSVLDIKLRSGTKEKEKATFGIGTLNSYVALEGPLNENSTYIISGRAMYYDLIQKGFLNNSGNPFYNFYDLNSKFTYNLTNNDVLSISTFYSKDRLYSPDSEEDLEYEMSWLNGSASLNWLHTSEQLISNATLSYVEYQFNSKIDNNLTSLDATDYFASSKLRDFILRYDFEVFAHEDHKIKSGLEMFYHNYNLVTSNMYHYSLELNSDVRTNINSLEFSGYFLAESQFSGRLRTNVGARLYYFSGLKKVSVEPRASFLFNIIDNLSFKGAYAETHQFMHLLVRNDISLPTDFWYPSTKEISPGKSREYVAGFEYHTDDNGYIASLESYYRDMNDVYEFRENIRIHPSTPISELITKGKGEAYGIEFFLNKTTGKFTGWLGYTWSYTRRLFDELNAGKMYYPKYDRRHDISVVLAYKILDNLSVSTTWTYATGQGITMPIGQFRAMHMGIEQHDENLLLYSSRNEYRLPAYHKLDLSLTYDIISEKTDISLYLNLYNVYNRNNVFAQYLSFDEIMNEQTGDTDLIPRVKQIVLFPFIPTFGVKINL